MSAFGPELRRVRTAAGWTLAQLAEALGISVSYLSDIERGNRGPLSDGLIEAACASMSCREEARSLIKSAGIDRGGFVLPQRFGEDAEMSAEVAAELAFRWCALSSWQLEQIRRILE